jgi:methylmalonyl-CoA mutase C-terminal domain/subunit
MSRGPRVLLTKLGLDGHDRAVHMLALELRDRGAEVVMLGTGTSPEQLASVAVEEDVAAIGISLLSGAHLALVPRVMERLREGGDEVPVVCGGVIPAADAEWLLEQGVAAVAPVGTSVTEAVDLLIATAVRGSAEST